MRAQTAYLQSLEVSAPQFIFLKPDGDDDPPPSRLDAPGPPSS